MQISSPSMFGSFLGAGKASSPKAAAGANAALLAAPQDSESASGARSEFAKYMKMTPAERMHAALLAQMGVTEEEYKAMSPEDRAALDAKIQQKIKQQLEASSQTKGKTGVLADVKV
jgi:hypothetical protein